MEDFKFDYDEDNDSLFIYLPNKKSNGAVEFGDFVLDFDKDENLVSIELLEASKILSKLVSRILELTKIKKMKAEIFNFRNMAAIKIKFSLDSQEVSANIMVPRIREQSPALSY